MVSPWLVAVLGWLVVAPPLEGRARALSFESALRSGEEAADVRGAAEAASVATKGVRRQPRVTSNPIVSANLGARTDPREAQGFEGTVGISQPLSMRRLGAHRRAAMVSEAKWRAAVVDDLRVQRDLAIAFGWLELRRAEELEVLTRSQLEVEQARVAELERMVGAGERHRAALVDARAELARCELVELDAQGRVVDAAHALARALGHGDGQALATQGPLPEAAVPSPEDWEALFDAVDRMPSVRAAELLAAAEEARGMEGWASAGQKVSVGVQVQRESPGSTIVQGTIAVPIPVVKPGVRARTQHQANAAELRGQAADRSVQLRAQMRTMLHDLEHTDRVHAEVHESVLPSAQAAVSAWEREAAAGEVLRLQVLDARRRLLDVEQREIAARIDRAWARVQVAIFAAALGGER